MGKFKKRVDFSKIPGHWVLASLGKTVLRPGGIELTHKMLKTLNISASDKVVEFAPGVGRTARLTLGYNPLSYTAIEQDEDATNVVKSYLNGENQVCVLANASETSLPDSSSTVVYGEAMLTMQADGQKEKIIQEAYRILEHGGRYAIHEMSLQPEDATVAFKETAQKELSKVIRVNARPLTIEEWKTMLERNGLRIVEVHTAPMHLLHVKRLIADEGLLGTLKIGFNCLTRAGALKRVLALYRVFRKYEPHLGGVTIIAEKHK